MKNIRIKLDIILLFIFLIILDQVSKLYVSGIMLENSFENINLTPFLDFVFVRNTGVSFGLFSDSGYLGRYFFSIFSTTVAIALIIVSLVSDKKYLTLATTLIASGALGNAIDRIYFGGVIDFIDIFLYNYHWPAFNFADIFISIGVVLLIIESFLEKKYEKSR